MLTRTVPLVDTCTVVRGRATMVSVELVFAYLAIVLVFVTIFVLCCLWCSCHVPLSQCIGCFCSEARRCCPKGTKTRTKPGTAASVLPGRQGAADAKDEPPCAGCLRGIPWVLTCGYCCGNFGDVFTTDRQVAKSAKDEKTPPAVVMQPVFENGKNNEPTSTVVRAEPVVAATMPLLSV